MRFERAPDGKTDEKTPGPDTNASRISGPDIIFEVGKGIVAFRHSSRIPLFHDHCLLLRVEVAPVFLSHFGLIQIVGAVSLADLVVDRIKDVQRDPFKGLGKPEPLKHELKGCWSRRIDQEHRLFYQVLENKIRVLACRYDY